jgi:hypothetical protein
MARAPEHAGDGKTAPGQDEGLAQRAELRDEDEGSKAQRRYGQGRKSLVSLVSRAPPMLMVAAGRSG